MNFVGFFYFRVARRGFSSYTTTGASFIIHIRSPSSSSPRPSLHKKKEKKSPQRRLSPAASSLEWINSSFLVPLATGIEIRSSSEKSHPSVGYVNIFSSGEYTPINPSIHPSSRPLFLFPLSLIISFYFFFVFSSSSYPVDRCVQSCWRLLDQ